MVEHGFVAVLRITSCECSMDCVAMTSRICQSMSLRRALLILACLSKKPMHAVGQRRSLFLTGSADHDLRQD